MIKLIVGLGNPGQQYQKNRHNAGFLFLDQLAKSCSGSWVSESRFSAVVANCFIANVKVILLKPQTFMNRSGLSVGAVARYYKIKVEEILVIHDELDFDSGVIKLKAGGGHAGHNGLRDIISNLGEKTFFRARVGIGRPTSQKSVADYVLSDPAKDEKNKILHAYDLLEAQITKIISGDINDAMNNLNQAS
ncbi:MAG: aminoacyl-tRNA hydrolase [Methylococcales bacterium]|nr:aminoacyl-tRNA hydrolase [Methylococcales bacterium]